MCRIRHALAVLFVCVGTSAMPRPGLAYDFQISNVTCAEVNKMFTISGDDISFDGIDASLTWVFLNGTMTGYMEAKGFKMAAVDKSYATEAKTFLLGTLNSCKDPAMATIKLTAQIPFFLEQIKPPGWPNGKSFIVRPEDQPRP